jgi:hypothetical protein
VYNRGIELMASSTVMQHVFFAFPSEIINTNGSLEDFHSFEIRIGNDVLDYLNDNIENFDNSNQYFMTYMLNERQLSQAYVHHQDKDANLDFVYLMCNKSGLYASLNLRLKESNTFYFVKLVSYNC